MHRRERKGDGDDEEEEEEDEVFLNAHLRRRAEFVFFIRSQRDGLAVKSAKYWIGL